MQLKHDVFRYAVSVAAFNGAGTGPFSIPLFQDTREGGKYAQVLSLENTDSPWDFNQNLSIFLV